jgi:hypothetical protein
MRPVMVCMQLRHVWIRPPATRACGMRNLPEHEHCSWADSRIHLVIIGIGCVRYKAIAVDEVTGNLGGNSQPGSDP